MRCGAAVRISRSPIERRALWMFIARVLDVSVGHLAVARRSHLILSK
jgi:hypothetical protein